MLSLHLRERGDTMIEVLVAIAIISLVLVTAYALTNKNTQAIQANQERIQAQHLAESQLEALKAAGAIAHAGGCFVGVVDTASNGCNPVPPQPGSGASYNVQVDGPAANNIYTVNVSWISVGGTPAKLSMVYRLQ